ncbi:hypothetical protein M885DRAFT_564923 [Pelagophyceae sp. CCMP2097]|nr:hypothetical protein M885DRAFT_564923 [Pelagophyceae sp. CCMP2097]
MLLFALLASARAAQPQRKWSKGPLRLRAGNAKRPLAPRSQYVSATSEMAFPTPAAKPRTATSVMSDDVEELSNLMLWGIAAASALAFANDANSPVATYLACASGLLRLPRVAFSASAAGQGLAEDDAVDFYFRRTESAAADCEETTFKPATVDCAELFATSPLYADIEKSAAKLLTAQHPYYLACCAALLALQHGAAWTVVNGPDVEGLALGHVWNALDGLVVAFSTYFAAREGERQSRGARRDSVVLFEYAYSVSVNGSMLGLALFSILVERQYGVLDFLLFALSMAQGTFEPVRFALARNAAA